MKKLLMILAACATAMVAPAAVKTQVDFESGLGGFTGTGGKIGGTIKTYPNNATPNNATKAGQPYPFSGNNNTQYCAVDADSEYTLTAPPESDATCFDMYVQFPVGATTPDTDSLLGGNAKVAVYLDYNDNKVCVVHGDGSGGTTTTETTTTVNPGDWVRLTIVKVSGGYKVYIDETAVRDSAFAAISGEDPSYVDFVGCGNLDNYVARTTNPFYSGAYAASVGDGNDNEKFATYSDALADVLASGATATITLSGETTKTLNGTAAKPYEITCPADLKALQEAVAAGYGTDKCYVQTADIALTEAWPGIGVQNGKDLVNYTVGTASGNITQEEADRRDAKWSAGAFKGTYDGGNYTISNFQMVGVAGNPDSTTEGLDYCGFFNSVDGATIKNLKIQYAGALFATDTTASTKESGATFVGVAKNSTLQNLTSLAGTVSCSKGFGGIVGYLKGTTVDSCTNNLNMTSLANNKCGGIAIICQQENCSISNCKNTGTMTTGSGEFGGIIGYTDTITISDCENTAACKMFYHHGGTVTLSGTNKGNATVASYTGKATPGLNFATVSGNVATFVADNALAAGNTYKVMAAGATATATLANAGDTISFDTSLFTPTYAITAATGLVATPSTSGSNNEVKTYTAAVQTFTITWKSDDNTTIDTTTVNYGVVPSHEDPTKVGYEFTGWDPAIDAANADATYTAKWEQTAIPVEVATAKTLVSVPQNCKASELIDTSNREKDDMLQVLNKATQKYYQWSYDGNGGWTPNNVATVGDNIDETPEANTIDLVRGEAVWVTRKDASKEILLNAVYTDDPVTVEVIKGYNLVAPLPKAGVDTIAIDEVVADDSTGKDRVFIPAEGKAPYNLDFKDGNWGYDKYTIKEGQLQKVRVTDVAIPAGTGFFYINNGDGKKDITLGGAN